MRFFFIAISIPIILAALAFAFVNIRYRMPGYRGAIGFKNHHPVEIQTIRMTGFRKPIDCGGLRQGEHSFNYLGPQPVPDSVTIVWRFVSDPNDHTATVSLASVPKDIRDGELFFSLSSTSDWSVAYAPHLQLQKLMQHDDNAAS